VDAAQFKRLATPRASGAASTVNRTAPQWQEASIIGGSQSDGTHFGFAAILGASTLPGLRFAKYARSSGLERGDAASGPEVPLMRRRRDQVSRRCRWLLERLSQPSSAAGLAALLALLVPQLADYAPTIVDLALTVIAIGAAVVAIVRCECRDCQDR
jgi:hypothetical protein